MKTKISKTKPRNLREKQKTKTKHSIFIAINPKSNPEIPNHSQKFNIHYKKHKNKVVKLQNQS